MPPSYDVRFLVETYYYHADAKVHAKTGAYTSLGLELRSCGSCMHIQTGAGNLLNK